jgi:hypothetical protein
MYVSNAEAAARRAVGRSLATSKEEEIDRRVAGDEFDSRITAGSRVT